MSHPAIQLTLKESIASDYYRLTGKPGSPFVWFTQALLCRYCSFTFTYWMRIAQKGWGPCRSFARIMHRHYCRKFCIDIGYNMDVGAGFYLSHGFSIVINKRTRIGNNVNVSQFVNIGSNDGQHYAVIGDNVYIGPNVCIVGGVTIGNNASIGAGAVVTADVPENATVAGVPARVLNYDNPGQFILNRYVPGQGK